MDKLAAYQNTSLHAVKHLAVLPVERRLHHRPGNKDAGLLAMLDLGALGVGAIRNYKRFTPASGLLVVEVSLPSVRLR